MGSSTVQAPPPISTREPTGKPPWPLVLLAGVEKSGKSYYGAQFSGSPLVGQTYWLEIGETTADQYGSVPGARYKILNHDGTSASIGNALWSAVRQPRGADGRPNLIVIDSMTRFWDLLTQEQQEHANARNRRRIAKGWKPNLSEQGDAVITQDQWNAAKKRWRRVMNLLLEHDGPAVLIARLDYVSSVGENGKPVEGVPKYWKVRAEKDLPYDVDAIVQLREYREATLTGVRSLVMRMNPDDQRLIPDFTVEKLLIQLGHGEPGATGRREAGTLNPEAALSEESQQLTADFRARIEEASQPSELEAVGGRIALVVQSERLARSDEVSLRQAYDSRMSALNGTAPPDRQPPAQPEPQPAAAAVQADPFPEDGPFPDEPEPPALASPSALGEEIGHAQSAATLKDLYDQAAGWYREGRIAETEAHDLRSAIDKRRAELADWQQ